MSAIGDYVYLTQKDWIAGVQGLSRDESVQSIYANKREEIRKRMDKYKAKVNIQTLQKELNDEFNFFKELAYYSQNNKIYKSTKQDAERVKMYQEIFKFVKEDMFKRFGAIVDGATLYAKNSISGRRIVLASPEKMVADNKTYYTKASLDNKVKELEKYLNEVGKIINKSQYDGDALKNYNAYTEKLKAIKKTIRGLTVYTHSGFKGTLAKRTHKDDEKLYKIAQIIGETHEELDGQTIIEALNDVIQKTRLSAPTSAIGTTLEEVLFLIAQYKAGQITASQLKKLKNFQSQGEEAGHMAYEETDFTPAIFEYLNQQEEYSMIQENGINYIINNKVPTQNKVDLTMTWANDDSEPLKINAKNYNVYEDKEIQLQSESKLFTYLQNENKDNFVNHYLNAAIPHIRSVSPYNSYVEMNRMLAREANEVIRELIFLRALTGDNVRKQLTKTSTIEFTPSANLFIVNNQRGGRITKAELYAKNTIRVFSINDLLEAIFDGKINSNFNSIFPDLYLRTQPYGAHEYPTAQARINNIIGLLLAKTISSPRLRINKNTMFNFN